MSRKLAVIAIGGNSLIKHRDKQSVEDQYLALCETMEHIADVIQQGWQVLITHGNGPQVGFIMLRSEIARAVAGMHIVPLVSCVADTQGAIGYQIQQSLDNVLKRRGLRTRRARDGFAGHTGPRGHRRSRFQRSRQVRGRILRRGSARGAAPTAS